MIALGRKVLREATPGGMSRQAGVSDVPYRFSIDALIRQLPLSVVFMRHGEMSVVGNMVSLSPIKRTIRSSAKLGPDI